MWLCKMTGIPCGLHVDRFVKYATYENHVGVDKSLFPVGFFQMQPIYTREEFDSRMIYSLIDCRFNPDNQDQYDPDFEVESIFSCICYLYQIILHQEESVHHRYLFIEQYLSEFGLMVPAYDLRRRVYDFSPKINYQNILGLIVNQCMFERRLKAEVHIIRVVQRELMTETERGKMDCAFHEDSLLVLQQIYHLNVSSHPATTEKYKKRLMSKGPRNLEYKSAVLRNTDPAKKQAMSCSFAFDVLMEEFRLLTEKKSRDQIARTISKNRQMTKSLKTTTKKTKKKEKSATVARLVQTSICQNPTKKPNRKQTDNVKVAHNVGDVGDVGECLIRNFSLSDFV